MVVEFVGCVAGSVVGLVVGAEVVLLCEVMSVTVPSTTIIQIVQIQSMMSKSIG